MSIDIWWTHFGDDEWLAVLEPSFQREPPRRAPAQLDLNVVERDELLNRFHSLPPLRLSVYPLLHPLSVALLAWLQLLLASGAGSGPSASPSPL